MNKGWKEAFTALAYAVIIGIAIALIGSISGCTGARVLLDYEHHSSAQDYHDLNESNHVGVVVAVPLRFHVEQCSRYCPEMEVGLHWEPRDPVFGRNPVGTIRIRQPLFVFD